MTDAGGQGRARVDDLAAVFDGIDGPRPLPAELRAELLDVLAADGVVRGVVASGVDAPAAVPEDLRARLEATLLGAGLSGGMSSRLQRRLLRVLPGGGAPGTGPRAGWRRLGTETMLVRVAAVAAALLLVSGLAVAAVQRAATDGPGVPETVAAPPAAAPTAPPETTIAPPPETTTTTGPRRPKAAPAPRPLVTYASCADLLQQTKQRVLAVVGAYGLAPAPMGNDAFPSSGTAAAASGGSTAGGSSAAASVQADEAMTADPFSATNVQEDGVDEPDVVKTDGRRVVTISGRTLRVLTRDRATGALAVAGSFELPANAGGSELLLTGDRAVVLSDGVAFRDVPATEGAPARLSPRPADAPSSQRSSLAGGGVTWSTVRVVDLADPAAMRLVSTLYLEGSYRTARLASGRVRVVVQTNGLGPVFEYPNDGTEEAKAAALGRNRDIVAASTLDDWMPRYVLVSGSDQATVRSGRLCACDGVLRPQEFAGVDTISVFTIDPANPTPGDGSDQGTAVQGFVGTVYASTSNVFVASQNFDIPRAGVAGPGKETSIHRFEIRGTEPAKYRGSGKVRGVPLNQWALSERGGYLRVATTEDRPTGKTWPEPMLETESFVTTLAVKDDGLRQAGQLGGLGHAGERIFGVRFVDNLAYVITFRQTDPVYVVDLTNPAAPAKRGELEVSGYSAYLHPLESGYLLGVGRDWVDQAGGRQAQLSSLDVRDPGQPTLVDRVRLGENSSTIVEGDHRAFLYWPATRLVVLPYSQYTQDSSGRVVNTSGVATVGVGADYRLTEQGRLTHNGREHRTELPTSITRSAVIGGSLYTFSAAGVLANDVGTLVEQQWLAY